MYGDDGREPNQDKDLVDFFKANNSYYDVKLLAKEIDMNKESLAEQIGSALKFTKNMNKEKKDISVEER